MHKLTIELTDEEVIEMIQMEALLDVHAKGKAATARNKLKEQVRLAVHEMEQKAFNKALESWQSKLKKVVKIVLLLVTFTASSQHREVWLTTDMKFEDQQQVKKVVDLILHSQTILNIDSVDYSAELAERGRRGRYIFSLRKMTGRQDEYVLLLDMKHDQFFLIRRRGRITTKFYSQNINR